jgi:hypothetical protein
VQPQLYMPWVRRSNRFTHVLAHQLRIHTCVHTQLRCWRASARAGPARAKGPYPVPITYMNVFMMIHIYSTDRAR